MWWWFLASGDRHRNGRPFPLLDVTMSGRDATLRATVLLHERSEYEGEIQARNSGTGRWRESTSWMTSVGSCVCSLSSGLM